MRILPKTIDRLLFPSKSRLHSRRRRKDAAQQKKKLRQQQRLSRRINRS